MTDFKKEKTPPTASTAPQTDIVTRINGNFGPWQLRTILLIFLCKIPSAWFMACIIYTAPTPQKGDYYCKPPLDLQLNSSGWVRRMLNSSNDQRPTDRRFRITACNIYEEQLERSFVKNHTTFTNPFEEPKKSVNIIPCTTFEYNADFKSLIEQFDLVCSRQLLVSATQSSHGFGALLGGLLACKALKYISPRRLMLIGMLFQIFCGNLTGLVNTFELHIFFRCLTSLFCALMYTSGHIILTDITSGKAKTVVVTLFELFWSIGLILLPGISIFFDSWSYLYVAISSSVIVLVFLHRWITDSPRWLLRQQKVESALQQLLESAAFNNRKIPLNLEFQLEKYAKELQSIESPSYWSIWELKNERKYLYAIHWTWVGTGILLNVMLLTIRSLGVEHIHVNTACMGFVEMIGVFIGLYFILYTRRPWLWSGYIMITVGLFTYFIWFVPQSPKRDRQNGFELFFWLLLKLTNSASQSVLTTCTGELVSKEKRPLLMLSVMTFSRICLLPAPFISVFSLLHRFIPITIFASLGIVNGLLMRFLDRTFWNYDHPRIQRVLTLKTYRRTSTIALLKRNPMCSENSAVPRLSCNDNPITISISDLWYYESETVDRQLHVVKETENSLQKSK